MSSFYLWLDNELLKVGNAFTPTSGKLYPCQDRDYADFNVYSSPFRQWVSDSSIESAIIPSGVYINGQFANRQSGVIINYNKGEVLLNKSLGAPKDVTTNYTKKDFNIYYTDEREENLLFENSYSLSPKFTQITGGLNGEDRPFPCIFLKNTSYENKPYALGGEDKTVTTIRCIILADNMYLLDGAISLMTDSARKVFPIIPPSGLPYNYYGDFKYGSGYQYAGLAQDFPENLVYIDRVTVSRMDEIRNKKINIKTVAALVDFELWQARNPRKY